MSFARPAAHYAAALVLGAAALAGLADVGTGAARLSLHEAAVSVALWIAFALPPAAGAALAGAALARAASPDRHQLVRALVLAGAVQAAAVGGLAAGLYGPGPTAALALAGLVAVLPLARLDAARLTLAARRWELVLLASLPWVGLYELWAAPALARPLQYGLAFVPLALGWVLGDRQVNAVVTRRAVRAGAVLGWGAVLGSAAWSPPVADGPRLTGATPERPHVVLIVLDTQRADFLGAYGNESGLTPNIDALAAQSTVYEDAFATAGWTVPTHASLFTGLFPRTHGASYERHRWLDDRFTTLAEALRDAGYRTAAFVANEYVEQANLDQGFEHYRRLGRRFRTLGLRRPLQVLGLPAKWMDHGAADAVQQVDGWLEREAPGGDPVFLFVNLLEPHWRHLPWLPDRLRQLPQGIDPVTATSLSLRFYGPLVMAGKRVEGPLRPVVRSLYAGAVRYQDRQVGRLFQSLDAHLPAGETIVIVTADHGENLGEGGRWDHVFALNDALIHVPLLVRHPPAFRAGARVSGLCQQVDVPATLADLIPALRWPGGAGRTLVPARFEPREHVFAEGDPYYGHLSAMASYTGFERDVGGFASRLRAVRGERYKYVWSSPGRPALYDLARDPAETTDVSADHPETAARLAAALDAWRRATPGHAGGGHGDATPLDAETQERLRELGYLE